MFTHHEMLSHVTFQTQNFQELQSAKYFTLYIIILMIDELCWLVIWIKSVKISGKKSLNYVKK